MNDIQVFLTLIVVRLIVPLGIPILIGEWAHRREARHGVQDEHVTDPIHQPLAA